MCVILGRGGADETDSIKVGTYDDEGGGRKGSRGIGEGRGAIFTIAAS